MPNHSRNEFTFEKLNEKQFELLKKKLKGKDEEEIDFNNFIPQPKNLILWDTSNETEKILNIFYRDNPFDLTESEMNFLLSDQNAKIVKNQVCIDENLVKLYGINKEISPEEYKLTDWYRWNIDNWGTKWNAYDVEIYEDTIVFYTAWAPPVQKILNGIGGILADILGDKADTINYNNETEGEYQIDFFHWDDQLKELVFDASEYEDDEEDED